MNKSNGQVSMRKGVVETIKVGTAAALLLTVLLKKMNVEITLEEISIVSSAIGIVSGAIRGARNYFKRHTR